MGQSLKKMFRGKYANCTPLVQVHRLRRLALHLIGWRAGGGARAVQRHEWLRLVNSDFPRVQTKKSESLVICKYMFCAWEDWVAG